MMNWECLLEVFPWTMYVTSPCPYPRSLHPPRQVAGMFLLQFPGDANTCQKHPQITGTCWPKALTLNRQLRAQIHLRLGKPLTMPAFQERAGHRWLHADRYGALAVCTCLRLLRRSAAWLCHSAIWAQEILSARSTLYNSN